VKHHVVVSAVIGLPPEKPNKHMFSRFSSGSVGHYYGFNLYPLIVQICCTFC